MRTNVITCLILSWAALLLKYTWTGKQRLHGMRNKAVKILPDIVYIGWYFIGQVAKHKSQQSPKFQCKVTPSAICTSYEQVWFAAVNKTEAECLIRLFNGLLGDQSDKRVGNGLDRGKFRNILHNTFGMTDDMIMDRGMSGAELKLKGERMQRWSNSTDNSLLVFRAFDKDNDSYVGVKEWIEGLSVFLRGTLDEKIKCNSDSITFGCFCILCCVLPPCKVYSLSLAT